MSRYSHLLMSARDGTPLTGNPKSATPCLQKPRIPSENDTSVTVTTVDDPEWKPFPVDVLPKVLKGFATAAARAIGCDVAYLAAPLMVLCAAAIGNSRRVRLKHGWDEPAIAWLAIVGDSGTHKSPALEVVLRPMKTLQRLALKDHDEKMRQYNEIDLPSWDRDYNAWKKSKDDSPPPAKPAEPVTARYVADDLTLEALASLLANQPRGLLVAADELAGWFGSFDKYRSGAGGDSAKWLEAFGGRTIMIDRKTGTPKTLCIPHAAVSVLGGIQPEILAASLTSQHRASGLSARMLLCWPPRRQKRWSEAELPPDSTKMLQTLVERLLSLEMMTDEHGELSPKTVTLDQSAKALFVEYYNRHAQEQSTLCGEMAAVWSKLEAYGPRLALVVHAVRRSSGEIPPERELILDAVSMQAGITLAGWFGHEARRVHAMLGESESERELRLLEEWIRAQGGTTTVRDLMQGHRRYRKSADNARAALESLVKLGHGVWDRVETGGRPGEVFRLSTAVTVTEVENPLENDTSVTSDPADGDGFDESGWELPPEPTATAAAQPSRDGQSATTATPRLARPDMPRLPPWLGGGS